MEHEYAGTTIPRFPAVLQHCDIRSCRQLKGYIGIYYTCSDGRNHMHHLLSLGPTTNYGAGSRFFRGDVTGRIFHVVAILGRL